MGKQTIGDFMAKKDKKSKKAAKKPSKKTKQNQKKPNVCEFC